MTGWLIVATVVVVVLGLADWTQRQLSRGGFATTLGRLVVFARSAGSAAFGRRAVVAVRCAGRRDLVVLS